MATSSNAAPAFLAFPPPALPIPVASLPPPLPPPDSVLSPSTDDEKLKKMLAERMRVRYSSHSTACFFESHWLRFVHFRMLRPGRVQSLHLLPGLIPGFFQPLQIMDEFLQTETTYLYDLKSLKKLYLDPLSKDPELLPKDDFNVIFSVRFNWCNCLSQLWWLTRGDTVRNRTSKQSRICMINSSRT
jgi:hypothetical protein